VVVTPVAVAREEGSLVVFARSSAVAVLQEVFVQISVPASVGVAPVAVAPGDVWPRGYVEETPAAGEDARGTIRVHAKRRTGVYRNGDEVFS
jgi:hypothetical protein